MPVKFRVACITAAEMLACALYDWSSSSPRYTEAVYETCTPGGYCDSILPCCGLTRDPR